MSEFAVLAVQQAEPFPQVDSVREGAAQTAEALAREIAATRRQVLFDPL